MPDDWCKCWDRRSLCTFLWLFLLIAQCFTFKGTAPFLRSLRMIAYANPNACLSILDHLAQFLCLKIEPTLNPIGSLPALPLSQTPIKTRTQRFLLNWSVYVNPKVWKHPLNHTHVSKPLVPSWCQRSALPPQACLTKDFFFKVYLSCFTTSFS